MGVVYYRDGNWILIPEIIRVSPAFVEAKHAHTCPDCDRWTTGTGLSRCPNCSKQNMAEARKYNMLKFRQSLKSESNLVAE